MYNSIRRILREELENINLTTLYHGSPNLFDKFLTSKINTGQHSQDFGYGLYFTTDKQTAEFYANELSHSMSLADKYKSIFGEQPNDILEEYINNGYSASVKRVVKSMIQNGDGDAERLNKFLDIIDKPMRYSYVYTVKINNPHFISRDEYVELQHKNNLTDKEMTKLLLSQGYNGVIYKMNSFGCNTERDFQSERNVVIFDDSCITIESVEPRVFDYRLKVKV